jgi:AraC family transcriptional regulator
MPSRLTPGSFYGEKVKSVEVGGLLLTDHRYPPHLQVPEHSHERAYFCLVLQGAYTESCGAQTRDCKPLTLLYHPSGEVHSDQFHDSAGRLFGLEISLDWQERIREYAPLRANPAEMPGGMAAWIALRLYQEFRQMDSLSPLAIQGLALELMAEASRYALTSLESIPPRWLRRVQEQIEAQFAEPPSLEELAHEAGVHPMHLIRAFRQQYRCTIGDYVRRVRVECAARQLAVADVPLAQIAREVGFSDQSHFTRTFKQITGMTPARFRETARSR